MIEPMKKLSTAIHFRKPELNHSSEYKS